MEDPEEIFYYDGQDDNSEVPLHVRRTLTHVRFDSSVKEIPPRLFQFCFDLVTVELNEGLKFIKEDAFHGCTSLRQLIIPSSVKKIESRAFLH